MIGALKQLLGPATLSDLPGRFGAWWDGREYAPAIASGGDDEAAAAIAPAGSAAASAPDPAPPAGPVRPPERPPEPFAADGGLAPRVLALETLWGRGRLSPGDATLDELMLDFALEPADRDGQLGLLGLDSALARACAGRWRGAVQAADWRAGHAPRLGELTGLAPALCDVDRPRCFADGSLSALVSVDALAFADHKSGLVARAWRALSPQGAWAFIEPVRRAARTPAAAFASAWAEPQLATSDEIRELLLAAGFASAHRQGVTHLVAAAAREAFAAAATRIEAAAATAGGGRAGALVLQELAWEAASWRARLRALAGGALGVDLWLATRAPWTPGLAADQALERAEAAAQAGCDVSASLAGALFD